jgi:hypothetical protein
MARLRYIDAGLLSAARATFRPPLLPGPSWKAARPRATSGLEPWFELTPRACAIDTRVTGGDGVGVAASLETHGGVTGPDLGAAAFARDGLDPPEVTLGGCVVQPGTPAPDDLAELERQCTVRIAASADDLARGGQLLLLVAVRGLGDGDSAIVQSLVGHELVGEDLVRGEDRLGALVDIGIAGAFSFEVWLRLAGPTPRARLGVRGAQGFLL